MVLPTADTPLYNHPLPDIEQWLNQMGGEQDREQLHCWRVEQPSWQAELYLEVEELIVTYIRAGESGRDIQRSFKYSLSRQDVENAVLAGP